jgi:protein-S-isoprenylcysteine O-methyltransferase Ste14
MTKKKSNKPKWSLSWKDRILSYIAAVLIIFQIILSFFLYNHGGLGILRNFGLVLLLISAVFIWFPIVILRRKGGVPEEKSYFPSPWKPHTTVLVDSGIYAVVRHPQYLAGIFFSFSLIIIAQQWLITIIGIVAIVSTYGFTIRADQECVEKFGDSYKRYMKSVPRLNILMGIVQLTRRRRRENAASSALASD